MALVKDCMSEGVVFLNVDDTIYDVSLLMKEKGVSSVIVYRNRKPAGIVTERDIVWRVVCEKKDPAGTKLADVMSSPLIAVSPLTTLDEAALIMERTGVKRLCVLSGEILEGIVSITDIMAAESREVEVLERYVRLLSAERGE